MPPDDPFDPLEKTLHALLRDQPLLRAPVSLEQRVRAGIARRAVRPWWMRSLAEWPLPARTAFFVLSGGVVALSIVLTLTSAVSEPGAGFGGHVWEMFTDRFAGLFAAGESARAWATSRVAPWVYISAAAIMATYVALWGLGVTAYRLLWKHQ